ncbi:MAG: hypothetical protein AAB227_07385 [Pseudomonadota bacterium]
MLIAVLLAGLVFYEAFVALKSLANVQAMQETVRGSFAVVQSTTMSDEDKAAAMQKSSVAMMGAVGVIFGKILIAVAASAAFLYAVSLFTWPFHEIVEYSVKPLPLLAVIVILSVYGMVRHGRRK